MRLFFGSQWNDVVIAFEVEDRDYVPGRWEDEFGVVG